MEPPAEERVPGEWYVVAGCKLCRNDFVVVHDPDAKIASGILNLQPEDGVFRLSCRTCQRPASYQRLELRSVHAK